MGGPMIDLSMTIKRKHIACTFSLLCLGRIEKWETGSLSLSLVQAGLELTVQPRLISNLWHSFFSLVLGLLAGVTKPDCLSTLNLSG